MPKNDPKYMREYQRESRSKVDPIAEALKIPVPEDLKGEVDLAEQLKRVKQIIRMDISNIQAEALNGKLKASSTEAIGLYARLLNTMIKEQKDYLDGLSDEELEKLANGPDKQSKD